VGLIHTKAKPMYAIITSHVNEELKLETETKPRMVGDRRYMVEETHINLKSRYYVVKAFE